MNAKLTILFSDKIDCRRRNIIKKKGGQELKKNFMYALNNIELQNI